MNHKRIITVFIPILLVVITIMANELAVTARGNDSDDSRYQRIYSDYGDLPRTYPAANHLYTLYNPLGPRLGNYLDSENSEQWSINADGDDKNHITDDEDGVTRADAGGTNNGWKNGALGGALRIKVTKASGVVQVWLDFNGDGNLTEVTLKDSTGTPVNQPIAANTTSTVYFDIPAGTFDGSNPKTIYARVRISRNGGLSAGGEANQQQSGEVEDYRFDFGPNAVSLLDFSASETALHLSTGLILLAGGLFALGIGGAFLLRRTRL